MDSLVFIAKRVQRRWDAWGDEGPDTEDIPSQHIQDLESLATEWMAEHQKEMNGDTEHPSEPNRLIQDNDCHWYVIPCYREDDFREWVRAQELGLDWGPTHDWEPQRVNGPHTVQFYEWDE